MRALFKAIAREGFLSFFALVVLILLVWFGGEYFAIDTKRRSLAIFLLLVFWFLLYGVQRYLAIRAARRIEDMLRSQAEEHQAGLRPDKRSEAEELQEDFFEGVDDVKAQLGKDALTALPLYVVLGPSAAGKTTAIKESGLTFLGRNKKGKFKGVGGTRNCVWWFTDMGMLLDTAGRYTTEEEDQEEWLSFLEMIKKSRRRKPLSGAIVAVSIEDVLKATDEGIQANAERIRDRLKELAEKLEEVFPVYLLFTKCDLLNGFVEFFEDLSKTDRAQVWGFTLPYGKPSSSYGEVFHEEARKLYGSLCARRTALLSTERPPAKLQCIHTFPLQFALVQGRLGEFVSALYPQVEAPREGEVLRGVYFSSGTQEGSLMDQFLQAMETVLGKGKKPALVHQVPEKKSYFIQSLFTRIVFPDKNLARSSSRIELRRRVLRYAAVGGTLAAFLFVAASLAISFSNNLNLLGSAGKAVKELSEAGAPPDRLKSLENLRREAATLDAYSGWGSRPIWLGWGLYSGDKFNEDLRRIYFQALKSDFVDACHKRMRERLEAMLSSTGKNYTELHEMHSVYQLLSSSDRKPKLDPAEVEKVLLKDKLWTFAPGGSPANVPDDSAEPKAQLEFLLAQLGRDDVVTYPLDPDLDARVKGHLETNFWEIQVYQKAVADLALNYQEVLNSKTLLADPSGKDLFTFPKDFAGFSGIYTPEGWRLVARDEIDKRSKELSAKYARSGIDKPAGGIRDFLTHMYLEEDYWKNWVSVLDSIRLGDFETLQAASEKLKVLTAPESPYRKLFDRVWKALSIEIELGKSPLKPTIDLSWLDKAMEPLEKLRSSLDAFLAETPSRARFLPLDENARVKLIALGARFQETSKELEHQIQPVDRALREKVKAVLYQPVENCRRALSRECAEEVSVIWNRDVYQYYLKNIDGRYPFQESAGEEASLDSFLQFFAPEKGLFFSRYKQMEALKGVVIEGKALIKYSDFFTDAVQRAEVITGTFFKTPEAVSLHFKVKLFRGEGVRNIEISLGGDQRLDNYKQFDYGELTWSPAKSTEAKVTIQYGDIGTPPKVIGNDVTVARPWGLFRLLRDGKLEKLDEEWLSFKCTWGFTTITAAKDTTYSAGCQVEMDDKEHNPFKEGFFSTFKVPEKVNQ